MFFRHWFLHGWLVVVLGSKRTLIFHRQRNMASSVVSSQGETPTDGEEDEQSEVLFRTFVKIKAEKEQKNEIKAAVEDEADPEEAAQVNEERNKEIGSRLASIADEIDEEYKTEIDDMIEQLQLTSENAYDNFSLLATRLLARGGILEGLTPPCIHAYWFRCNVGTYRCPLPIWIPHYCPLLH